MCFCCFTNLHCFTLTLPKVVLLNVGINNIAICLCERRRPTAFKNLAPCKHSKSSLTGFVFVNISQFFLIEKHFIILFTFEFPNLTFSTSMINSNNVKTSSEVNNTLKFNNC